MSHAHFVAQQAALDFDGVTDDAAIADAGLAAQVGVGTDAALLPDTYMPLDDAAGLDDRALAQLQGALDDGEGMDAAADVGLLAAQLGARGFQLLPGGGAHGGRVSAAWRAGFSGE